MKRSIDDLLRDTLRARAADPTAACLDPETAAAFVDGTMSARARASAEAHVADCPRCQAVLAALVRSAPPPVERPWWRRPAVAWLAPLTVAATAVAIWINVSGNTPVQTPRNEAPPLASSPVQPAIATPAAPQTQSQFDSAAARLAEAVGAREAANDSAKARLARTSDAVAGIGDARQVAVTSQAQVGAPATPAVAPQARGADAASSAEPNLNRPIAAEPARPSTPAGTAVTVTASPPVVDSFAVTRSLPRTQQTTIVSANRTSQWRLGAGSQVQHSVDGGTTWRTQDTGVNITPIAGSSPSPSVCWLVGPGGLVLITTDQGQSWRRLPFPVATDPISVRATDDRTATIVSSDGRTFVTSDAGRTWKQ